MADTPAAEAPAAKKKGGKGKWIIIAVVLLALAGGGGATWFFMRPAAHDEHAEAKPKKVEPPKPPVFVALEMFTVNLQSEGNQPHYLQTTMTLQVVDSKVDEQLKLHAPAIRNAILILLSGKKATELITVEGKQKLADEVVALVNTTLPAAPGAPAAKPPEKKEEKKDAAETTDAKAPEAKAAEAPAGPVQAVLFTAFIIQ